MIDDEKIDLIKRLMENALAKIDEVDELMFTAPEHTTSSIKEAGLKFTVTIPAKTVTIDRCYHTCPYFGLDGGPSPVMVCEHPSLKGYEGLGIISHPDCDTGFPRKCPLRDCQ